ncbi:MAG TPA: ribosomal protein S18-alanine N-acetyltransferase [Gemmatimonadales bacterium]|nr:ribosomal protein S18-alanine N-acetyltransferase [Gemmatimonadales bacterium]
MGARFQVRAADLADVPALAAIEPRCFSDPWSAAGFQEMLSAPSILGLIAEGKSRAIAGYIVARVIDVEGEILNLAVAPERRRQGIGALLLESVLDDLRTRGVEAVFLEVRVSNQAAINLYLANGFHPIGQRHGYYRRPVEDAMVLRWESAGAGRR